MAKQSANEPKRRGRPAKSAETLAQRLERLEQEAAAVRKEVAEEEQRKLAAVGRAVLAEAEGNATFMAELRRILRERVTTKAGKADLAAFMAETSSPDA